MANVSDPLVNSLSGSDPQNLMEYITRQKIYDSRYWKEECFGLTVADVLEKAASQLHCIGSLPTKFLALTLKLLQLHPETELIVSAFIEQDDFKYVRALGCFYIRLTARPVQVYDTLEPLYSDGRKLRVWDATTREWSLLYMDEFIHQLLNCAAVLGMALPRLPSRRVLQEAGYIAAGPRPTALPLGNHNNDPYTYFRYKVEVEKSPAAIAAWQKRCERLGIEPNGAAKKKQRNDPKEPAFGNETAATASGVHEEGTQNEETSETKHPKKKQRNYSGLFKKDDSTASKRKKSSSSDSPTRGEQPPDYSDEYWNAERARLGLKPLTK